MKVSKDEIEIKEENRLGVMIQRAYAPLTLSRSQKERLDLRVEHAVSRASENRRSNLWVEFAVMAGVLTFVLVGLSIWTDRLALPDIGGNDPSQAVTTGEIRNVLSALQTGAGRYLEVTVRVDDRLDESSFNTWHIQMWEQRLDEDGTHQQRIEVNDSADRSVALLIRSGESWFWNQRGWTESGAGPMVDPPEEIRLLQQELQSIIEVLDDSFEGTVQRIEEDEIEIRRITGESPEYLEQHLGVAIERTGYEVIVDKDTNRLQQSRRYYVTEDREERSLGTTKYISADRLHATDLDNDLFAIPDEVASEEFQYQIQLSESLPLGLEVVGQRSEFMGGSESIDLSGDGIELRVDVYPSRGGFDPRSWIASREQNVEIKTLETEGGLVWWLANQNSGWPQVAFWDHGDYRFELTVTGTFNPELWTESTLADLVTALNN